MESETTENNNECQIHTTTRGKRFAIHKSYKYYFYHEKDSNASFKCHMSRSKESNDKCNATLILSNGGNVTIKGFHRCNGLSVIELKKYSVKQKIANFATTTHLTNKEIVCNIHKECDNFERASISSGRMMRRQITKLRTNNQEYSFINNSDIPIELHKSNSGFRFLQKDTGINDNHRILIFINEEHKIHMKNSTTWLSDGTFKMAPQGFTQVYVIFVKLFNIYKPLCFGILKDKTEQSYTRFLRLVKELIEPDRLSNFIVDFEQAPINAISAIFPSVRIYNCLFHYGQIVWKLVQSKGLVCDYKKSVELRNNIKMLLALPFTPLTRLNETFNLLDSKIRTSSIKSDELNEILNYVHRNYINGGEIRRNGWSCFERSLNDIPLTTNVCEGWNRYFNSTIETHSPSLIRLIMVLISIDHINEAEIIKAMIERPQNRISTKNTMIREVCNNEHEYYGLTLLTAISSIYMWPF